MNLRAVGATTAITGWTSEGTVTVNPVATAKTPAGLEAIDMGNGLKWANMNVGRDYALLSGRILTGESLHTLD